MNNMSIQIEGQRKQKQKIIPQKELSIQNP
jgi:hypothetical protein